MHHPLTDIIPIEELDTDGAIRETADAIEIDGDTRASFFKKAGMAGGGLLAGSAIMGALPGIAGAAVSSNDTAILNYALTLEYLERAFYREAVARNNLFGPTKAFAFLVFSHENTHGNTLRKVLGSSAVSSPKFNFHGTNRTQAIFQKTAFALENEGVHAYLGQAGNIESKTVLGVAASIATVEARHAGAIAQIIGQTIGRKGITPNGPFDVPYTKTRVVSDVNKLKFTKPLS